MSTTDVIVWLAGCFCLAFIVGRVAKWIWEDWFNEW